MPHHITNRRRSYKTETKSFFWEGLNASTYIIGALCFVVGSVFFLPMYQQYSAAAAWLFIIGSAVYLVVVVHDFIELTIYYRRHKRRGRKTMLEFLTSTGYVIASVLFLVGSVCFLPSVFKEAWGAWCFIIGSALFAFGAAISVTQITRAGTLIGLQLLNAVAICFVIGSVLFLIPSIPYLWPDDHSRLAEKLFTYLASQFIFASVLFLGGGVVNFYRAYRMHRHHASDSHAGNEDAHEAR